MIRQKHSEQLKRLSLHSQVIGQVVLLQGVCFKPVRCPVKVVIPNATDEAFGLKR